jgi:ubiquinone/menaquinone biosynthesis C-methylase UbiE
MKRPTSYRKNIPFFCEKTATDYQKDIYERYEEMVIRQSALHLADQLWGKYPMQKVLDFAQAHYPKYQMQNILEIGCGVGRWIAQLAQNYPQANCWGIDYSYQMLKRAKEYWVDAKSIEIDLSNKGFTPIQLEGQHLENLHFGLAKASQLPFEDRSQDLVFSSFLLDRLEEPTKALEEMHRVLKVKGTLLLISPLNFNQAKHWKDYYPPTKIQETLHTIGFQILDWQENLLLKEPLDFRGNHIQWKCLAFAARKIG